MDFIYHLLIANIMDSYKRSNYVEFVSEFRRHHEMFQSTCLL